MKKAVGTVLVCGLIAGLGCDAGAEKPSGDPSRGSAGRGGTGGTVTGAAGFGVAGIGTAGTGFGGTGACTGVPCMCLPCADGCFDCGGGCTCMGNPNAQPLPWEPPFDAVGDAGWKDSTVPFCGGLEEIRSLDVWADERGVFVLVSGHGYAPTIATAPGADEDAGVAEMVILPVPPSGGAGASAPSGPGMIPGEYAPRTQIWFNGGEGWEAHADAYGIWGRLQITGLPGVAAILSQPDTRLEAIMANSLCPLGMLHGNTLECLAIDPVQSVFAVSSEIAYAIMGGTRLLEYTGERWRSNTALLPYPATAVWSDGVEVVAAGSAGTLLRLQGESWTFEDPGTLANLTALWGQAADDLWAGTAHGALLHYDGESWTEVAQLGGVTCSNAPPVDGIFGVDGVVYFHTATQLARWTGSEVETLANWSCSPNATNGALRITGGWATAPDQVFLTIIDMVRFGVGGCGPSYVVHYDGERFHRM